MIADTKEEMLKYLAFEREHDYGVCRKTVGGVSGYYKVPLESTYVPDMPQEWFADREFVTKAIQLNGNVLREAIEPLRYDRELFLIAAQNCPYNGLSPIPEEWKKIDDSEQGKANKEFLLKLVNINGQTLNCIYPRASMPEDVDMDIARAAIVQDYRAARIFSCRAFYDRDFALTLVNIHGRTLEYLPAAFRDDEEIVYAAVSSYRAFERASDRLRYNEAFLMKVLEKNPSCIAYAPLTYRQDKSLMKRLIDVHPYVYRYVKGALQTDVALAVYALKKDTVAYDFMNYKLKKDDDIIRALKEIAADENAKQEDRNYARRILEGDDDDDDD